MKLFALLALTATGNVDCIEKLLFFIAQEDLINALPDCHPNCLPPTDNQQESPPPGPPVPNAPNAGPTLPPGELMPPGWSPGDLVPLDDASSDEAADEAAEDFKDAVESVADYAVDAAQEAVDDAVDGQPDQVRYFRPYSTTGITFRFLSSDSTFSIHE